MITEYNKYLLNKRKMEEAEKSAPSKDVKEDIKTETPLVENAKVEPTRKRKKKGS